MTGSAGPLSSAAATDGGQGGSWAAGSVRRRTLAQTAARLRGGAWAPLDALLAGGAMILAHSLSPLFQGPPLHGVALRAGVVQALAFLAVGVLVGLYDWDVWRGRRVLLLRALATAVLAAAATLGVHYLAFYQPIGRRVTLLAVALCVPLVVLPRYALWVFLSHRPRRLLFVGDSPLQRHARQILEADSQHLYRVVAQWSAESAEPLPEAVARGEIDEVVLPGPGAELPGLLAPALACVPLGCRVRPAADFCEDVFRAVPVAHVTADWLLSRGWDSSDHLAEVTKRLSDVLLAALGLLLSAPLLGLLALAVRAGGDGPALFRQWRVGRYGRPFRIVKFRTMGPEAEAGGARWAGPHDERSTRLGGLLRRTRLDELPQLWNVLRGEMSFVGPRPERPEFTRELEQAIPFYGWRHLVRPGLTGWAQLHYPYGASVEDARRKLEYDLYYLRHYALSTDLTIVLRTLTRAMKGAR